MIPWLFSAALALEPGAAKGTFSSDCACMEVEPGVHADRYSTTWVPLAEATHLEHLEVSRKPLLSAVLATGGRVSLAERDDIPATVGRVRTVRPELPLRDQNSGQTCKHIEVPTIEPPALQLTLTLTDERRIDAAAVGRALRSKETALAACLGEGDEAQVALKVTGGGKLKPSVVGGTVSGDAKSCLTSAIKGLKADVSQRAPGTIQFAVAR